MSGELVVLAVFLAWWAGAATGAVIVHAYLTRDGQPKYQPCEMCGAEWIFLSKRDGLRLAHEPYCASGVTFERVGP